MTVPDLTYSAQFEALRAWIETLDERELATPSVLAGWTVGDLVSHLTNTGRSIAALEPADPDTQPITIAAYISGYASASEQIGQLARDITERVGENLIAELDQANAEAQHRFDQFGGIDRVVLSRRGPILLSAFLDTRLLELVVHAGDLARSLPHRNGPTVMPSAERRVLIALREVLTERAADPVEALAAASSLPSPDFIELAAGRREIPAELPPALAGALPLF
jgi:uncharacterized protein (TIGR03083 family)